MNVPKLRFKGFTDDYQLIEFGKLVNYQKGFAFKSSDYQNFGTRIIRITDTTSNSIKENDAIFIDNNKAKNYDNYLLKENDIIISSVGSKPPLYDSMVGKVILVPKHANKSLLNQNAIRFRAIKHNQKYLYNYLKQNSYTRFVESIMRGNANQRSIALDDLFKYPIILPSDINEENQVANFLSLLDKKIELQTKKIEDLKLYKLSLREKMFNMFETEEKTLSKILVKWNKKNKDNEYSYVESVSNKFGFIAQNEQFDDRNIASSNTNNYYVIEKGVFAYNPSRLNVGSLALKKDNKISLVSPLYECFTTNQNKDFLLEWFQSKEFKKGTFSKFEGGVRNTLNFTNLSTIKISLPNIETQNRISNILNKYNKLIELENKKLYLLQELKKGVMQNMFV